MTSEAIEIDHAAEEATRLLSALGAAWTTYRLYPNPVEQPAFQMAVEALATFEGSHLGFEVGAGWFAWNGEPLEARRDGVERLATQLYIHDVETLRLAEPPTARDLATFYQLIDGDEAGSDHGGVDAALDAAGITSLAVVRRGLLGRRGDSDDTDEPGRGAGADGDGDAPALSQSATFVVQGAPPEQVAAWLEHEGGGDPAAVAQRFVETFEEIHTGATGGYDGGIGDALAPYWSDATAPPPIVTLAGAFGHLDDEARLPILRTFLSQSDEVAHRLFLDQLSGRELAELAAGLSAEEREALLAYVRSCLDRDAGDMTELLPLLSSGDEIREERGSVAGRIGGLVTNPEGVLAVSGETFDALHDSLDEDHFGSLGREVIRGLFACETRDHRFRRLLRIWTGRVAAFVRMGALGEAATLLAAIREDPPYPRERRPDVDATLGKLLTPELLDDLVQRFSEGGETDDALALLTHLGPAAAAKLVESLAVEEDPGRRRALIDLVGAVGTRHPQPLIAALQDGRWFVVRNLATALGRTGRPEAAGALRKVAEHADHRVRGEALRALVRLRREEGTADLVAALSDRHERVRETALGYLRTGDFAGVDAAVAEAVEGDALPGEVLGPVVELLAKLRTSEALAALETLAGRKLALRSGNRAVRQAAREALKGFKR